MRGRKYKRKVGPLVVVSKDCPLTKAAANVPGMQIITIDRVNASLLAPGCAPGRLTLFTKAAIERVGQEKLFT